MMKWIWLVVAMLAFGAAWQAGTAGMLALCMLLGFVAILLSFFGFLAERVGSVAQTQSGREYELLAKARGAAQQKLGPRPEPGDEP